MFAPFYGVFAPMIEYVVDATLCFMPPHKCVR
jgi:hypothetical protein